MQLSGIAFVIRSRNIITYLKNIIDPFSILANGLKFEGTVPPPPPPLFPTSRIIQNMSRIILLHNRRQQKITVWLCIILNLSSLFVLTLSHCALPWTGCDSLRLRELDDTSVFHGAWVESGAWSRFGGKSLAWARPRGEFRKPEWSCRRRRNVMLDPTGRQDRKLYFSKLLQYWWSSPGLNWLTADVIPLFSIMAKNLASNYRPVSLTALNCKQMEHIIYTHIQNLTIMTHKT